MSSREVLRKQNDVVISKPSELRLPQLLRSFAMTIKKTFSALSNFNFQRILINLYGRKVIPDKYYFLKTSFIF